MNVDLAPVRPALELILAESVTRYRDRQGEQRAACLAVLVDVISGVVNICIDQGKVHSGGGWKPALEFNLSQWNRLELPAWREAYAADAVTLHRCDGSQVVVYSNSSDREYTAPFFASLFDDVEALLAAGVLDSLPTKRGFTVRVEDNDGSWDREWKKKANGLFVAVSEIDWEAHQRQFEALKAISHFNGASRACPKCGTSFVSVKNLGRCPKCQLLFFASDPTFNVRR